MPETVSTIPKNDTPPYVNGVLAMVVFDHLRIGEQCDCYCELWIFCTSRHRRMH